jgi:hypothetical protein
VIVSQTHSWKLIPVGSDFITDLRIQWTRHPVIPRFAAEKIIVPGNVAMRESVSTWLVPHAPASSPIFLRALWQTGLLNPRGEPSDRPERQNALPLFDRDQVSCITTAVNLPQHILLEV